MLYFFFSSRSGQTSIIHLRSNFTGYMLNSLYPITRRISAVHSLTEMGKKAFVLTKDNNCSLLYCCYVVLVLFYVFLVPFYPPSCVLYTGFGSLAKEVSNLNSTYLVKQRSNIIKTKWSVQLLKTKRHFNYSHKEQRKQQTSTFWQLPFCQSINC